MCDPVSLFIAGAAATAYTTNKAADAAKDQRNALKKETERQRGQARAEKVSADKILKTERAEGFTTRRTAKAAARTQSAGTASAFGPRSFFATA